MMGMMVIWEALATLVHQRGQRKYRLSQIFYLPHAHNFPESEQPYFESFVAVIAEAREQMEEVQGQQTRIQVEMISGSLQLTLMVEVLARLVEEERIAHLLP